MSGDDLPLRPMEGRDLEAVHALEMAIFPTPWSFNSYKFELEGNPASELWVIEGPGGEVAAYAVVWLLVDEAHVANIAVAPNYRQQGLGRRLLRHALVRAAKQGMRYATLEVRASNKTARNLYKSFGFEVVGKRKAYYRDNQEDALTMRLEALDRVLLAEA
jgi:ribosomal-protein-alanine N-acetyltransferase